MADREALASELVGVPSVESESTSGNGIEPSSSRPVESWYSTTANEARVSDVCPDEQGESGGDLYGFLEHVGIQCRRRWADRHPFAENSSPDLVVLTKQLTTRKAQVEQTRSKIPLDSDLNREILRPTRPRSLEPSRSPRRPREPRPRPPLATVTRCAEATTSGAASEGHAASPTRLGETGRSARSSPTWQA